MPGKNGKAKRSYTGARKTAKASKATVAQIKAVIQKVSEPKFQMFSANLPFVAAGIWSYVRGGYLNADIDMGPGPGQRIGRQITLKSLMFIMNPDIPTLSVSHSPSYRFLLIQDRTV